jgi:uncharacterized protein (TIGR02452 family)
MHNTKVIIFSFFILIKSLDLLSGEPNSKDIKQQRIQLYEETKKAADSGFYVDQILIKLDSALTQKMIEGTERRGIHNSKKVTLPNPNYKTQFICKDQDTLDMAESFQEEGLNPVALNLANPKNPGGGVEQGSGAQEESIFRRSNYYLALIPKKSSFYPIQGPEVIYTPWVQVFRTGERDGYQFRKPFHLAIIACAAINLSSKEKEPADYEKRTRNKIVVLLRTALEKEHDSIVLGAMGCGAFKNNPNKVAGYYREILNSEEFKGRFKKVGFAILYDEKLLENFRGQIIDKDYTLKL